MRLLLLTITFLFFFFSNVEGQELTYLQKIDSATYYLDNANSENRLEFLKKAIRISTEINNDTLI